MFTDVWGLKPTGEKIDGIPEFQAEGEVAVTAEALEGTSKSAKDYLGDRAFYSNDTKLFDKMPYYKHNGDWVSSAEYSNLLDKLVVGMDRENYDPILDGFDLEEPASDNFYSMLANKGVKRYGKAGNRLPITLRPNPFSSGDAIEDNSQDIAIILGAGTGIIKAAIKSITKSLIKNVTKEVVENGSSNIGSKLEYIFGKATGNDHNIARSKQMLRQLESIGIYDNQAGRSYLTEYLKNVFSTAESVFQSNGRVLKESFLMGPNGGLKMKSIWDGNNLITIELFGR